MKATQNLWLVVGAVLGGLAVGLGAFGAHGLEAHLAKAGSDPARLIAIWQTASEYQMYHALALLAVGLLAIQRSSWRLQCAGTAMTLGTLIFSGCLYALVLSGQKWLGRIVPIGGLLLIVGWICLTTAAFRSPQGPDRPVH